MAVLLPPLPFSPQALAPYVSEKTISFHYEKHHQGYVTNLNTLLKGTDLETKSLEDIISDSAHAVDKVSIFNNAAQVWNHTFYWQSLRPGGGGRPGDFLMNKMISDFGGFETFVSLFKQAGASQFGSGWAWLVLDKEGRLRVTKTSNADLPLLYGQKALLTCDVWEHAYYLDYQNRRTDYIETFLTHLVNWEFAEKNLRGM